MTSLTTLQLALQAVNEEGKKWAKIHNNKTLCVLIAIGFQLTLHLQWIEMCCAILYGWCGDAVSWYHAVRKSFKDAYLTCLISRLR